MLLKQPIVIVEQSGDLLGTMIGVALDVIEKFFSLRFDVGILMIGTNRTLRVTAQAQAYHVGS